MNSRNRVPEIRREFSMSSGFPRSIPVLSGAISARKGFFLTFILGFVVRLIPEVLSYPYPIGFDTIGYAARMKDGVVWYHWTSVFSTWLLYGILIPAYQLVRINPFVMLKFVAPTLYALNVCGIYYFARKALSWTTRKASIAAFFFAFQLASLRLSWDLYRNLLGLGIFLFALPFIMDVKTKKGFASFVLLSMLVVFSHELVSVVMFAVVLGVMASNFLKGERANLLTLMVAAFPSLAIFSTRMYLILFSVQPYVETSFISAYQPSANPGGLFFLADYLSVSNSVHHYSTYFDLFSSVFLLFGLLYLLCLPLVFVGFFRNKILDGLALMLVIGSFNPLIMPSLALNFWNRWMFMLVYPFTFYAVNGLAKVWRSKGGGVRLHLKWLGRMDVSKRRLLGTLLLTLLFASLFLASPLFFGVFGVFSLPYIYTYFPSTMLINTVPLQDVEGTTEAMEWLDENMNDGSCVLVHVAFLSWANLYLDGRHTIIRYDQGFEAALSVGQERGFNPIYLVWWNEEIGWGGSAVARAHSLAIPKYFRPVISSGRISVFKYDGLQHSRVDAV